MSAAKKGVLRKVWKQWKNEHYNIYKNLLKFDRHFLTLFGTRCENIWPQYNVLFFWGKPNIWNKWGVKGVFSRVYPNKKPNIWKLLFFSYGVLKTNIWFSKNRTFEMSENRTLEQMKNRTFEISRTNQLLGTTWHNVWRLGNPTLSAALTAALVTIME